MRILYTVIRVVVGLLFIFSGLIKINDPVGTAIKLEEYFEVFAVDFSPVFHSLVPMALVLAVFLTVLEVVLGVAVLINYKMKTTTWILLLLIIFFTFLTFYSAYFNKVTDCGCFGDAIKLTPWQSFFKDIVLLILICILFFYRKYANESFHPVVGHTIMISILIICVGLAVFAIQHLPFIDFRAYSVGSNIPSLMKPSDTYRYQYVMEKDGKEVIMDTYPTEEGYEFKEMILLNPEAQPKITDFGTWSDEGDFTEEILQGKKLIILIYDVEKANKKSIKDINVLIKEIEGLDIEPVVLTASGGEAFEIFRHEVQLATPYYFADGTVIKTISRSNPGVMLLEDGVVKGKWHYNDVPEQKEVKALLNN